MTLNELGALLLEARTRHNLSVQEMADRLKLPVSTIQAIEDGNLKGLPHPAYARGFIKAYASMVGVPADLVHEALAVLVEEETPPTPLVTRSSRMASFSPPRIDGETVLRLIGLLIVMAAAVAVFWFREPIITQAVDLWHSIVDQQETSQAPVSQPAADTDTGTPHSTGTPDAAQLAASTATPDDETNKPGTGETATLEKEGTDLSLAPDGSQPGTSAEAAGEGQNVQAVALRDSSTDSTPQGTQAQADAATHHQLVINAVDTCWVMVRPDSAKPTEFSLRKGEGATFTFNKSLTLRLGNAGGVRLTYDGKAMASPGARGQAKTLTFPPKP